MEILKSDQMTSALSLLPTQTASITKNNVLITNNNDFSSLNMQFLNDDDDRNKNKNDVCSSESDKYFCQLTSEENLKLESECY